VLKEIAQPPDQKPVSRKNITSRINNINKIYRININNYTLNNPVIHAKPEIMSIKILSNLLEYSPP